MQKGPASKQMSILFLYVCAYALMFLWISW